MPKNTQPVSIGRVVHYQAHGSPNGQHKSEPRAATITELYKLADGTIEQDEVGIFVMTPNGTFHNVHCRFDADAGPGTWRWPPRV